MLGTQSVDGHDLTEALNALESRFSTIVFLTDRELTTWSEKAVRQADELLIVTAPLDGPVGTTVALSPLEAFALRCIGRHRGGL